MLSRLFLSHKMPEENLSGSTEEVQTGNEKIPAPITTEGQNPANIQHPGDKVLPAPTEPVIQINTGAGNQRKKQLPKNSNPNELSSVETADEVEMEEKRWGNKQKQSAHKNPTIQSQL